MTEPTGRLAYGQAGAYDAIDDRAVIRALTGGRFGMVTHVAAVPGSGLNIVISGGWLGVADCGDNTSAVLGSPTDQLVEANPGPPTGTREDYVWADVDPDEGTYTLVTIPASTSPGRPGLPVVSITVPANATLASQMTIRPADALLDRRLLAVVEATESNTRTGNTWETVGTAIQAVATFEPGRSYRVRFTANSPMALTSQYDPPGMRIGIGFRAFGAGDATSLLWRASIIGLARINSACAASVERTYRHTGAPLTRHVDGRIWIAGTGSFRTCAVTNQGPGLALTVEELGT